MDHCDIAAQYVEDVLSGVLPACEYVRLACERQKNDLENPPDGYRFDRYYGNRVCKFIELLPHIKGEWAGTLIQLEPWQCFILTTVFGWVDEENLRRFKTVYVEVPRKNAKSTLSSGVGLYCMELDGEGGAEVYSAATTKDQAKIVWQDAKAMVDKCVKMQKKFGTKTSAHAIFNDETNAVFKALSRDHGGNLDGLNTHCAIIDELHAHKTRDVYDVIDTSTGARRQPLLWAITTAGFNRTAICYEIRDYVIKLLKKAAEPNDEFFGMIYTIDKDDDWTDPTVWAKANPNYNVSVKPRQLASLAKRAIEQSSAQNNFLTKHLNVWVNAGTAWMNMKKWDDCCDPSLKIEDFYGKPCYIAHDFASKVDIAAKIYLFPEGDKCTIFGKYYLPEETIRNSGNSQYEGWSIDGMLTATEGNVIDYDLIEDDLLEDAKNFELIECPYDPWQATQFSSHMIEQRLPMVEVRATVQNFSEPMKELEALVISGRLRHNGCPVLTWMMSNVVCKVDKKDNIYPFKEMPQNKIDGVISTIMNVGRWYAGGDPSSTYEENELLVI